MKKGNKKMAKPMVYMGDQFPFEVDKLGKTFLKADKSQKIYRTIS